VASEAPLERKYSRWVPGAEKSRRRDDPDDNVWFTRRTWTTLTQRLFNVTADNDFGLVEKAVSRDSANFFCGLTKGI
jgi:hypothetical protein